MMRVFSFFLFLLSIDSSFGCSISSKNKVISLSGVTTSLFDALDLLQDKNLLAISSFYHTENKNIRKLGGGLFLSKKELRKLAPNTIFYDQSYELEKKLSSFKIQNKIAIHSRGYSPIEVVGKTLTKIKPYLVSCNNKIKKIQETIKKKEQIVLNKNYPKCLIVFLGSLKKEQKPNLIMVQDGFMKFLIDHKKVASYNSELAYVSWSSREFKNYKNCTLVGIKENKSDSCHIIKIKKNNYNLSCPNGLVPGLGQLKTLDSLGNLL